MLFHQNLPNHQIKFHAKVSAIRYITYRLSSELPNDCMGMSIATYQFTGVLNNIIITLVHFNSLQPDKATVVVKSVCFYECGASIVYLQ